MEKDKVERPIIRELWAKNFRNLKDVKIELGPLTVLVGPNASGKSNIVDVLRFVADALRMDLDAAITTRHGIGAIRRWSKWRPYDVTIGLRVEGAESSLEYEFVLGSGPGGECKVKREHGTVELKGLVDKQFKFDIKEGKLVEPAVQRRRPEQISLFMEDMPPKFEETDLALRFIRNILPGLIVGREGRIARRIEVRRRLTSLYGFLRSMLFYHMFPNVIQEPQKPAEPYPLKEHGENLASVLREMRRGKSEFFIDLCTALGKVVPGVRDVKVVPVGGYLVGKLEHTRAEGKGGGAWFDLFQESDGTLRLLGLLVALFQDPPPSFIAIEEPELTIHPGALPVLADLLQEATQRTQILITTHSPDLIDRLPVESLRAVDATGGFATVSMVSDQQREAVRRGLFSPGELHRMEGLQPAKTEV